MLAIAVLVWRIRQPSASSDAISPASSGVASVRKVGPLSLYPDPSVTPGAVNPDVTQENLDQTICSSEWSTREIRPSTTYTQRLKRRQLQLQLVGGDPRNFEEDHLISLELGGHPTDPRNLWPERYEPRPGAHEKDLVENFLHRQVCSGAITLVKAQTEIASDWYAVYLEMQAERP